MKRFLFAALLLSSCSQKPVEECGYVYKMPDGVICKTAFYKKSVPYSEGGAEFSNCDGKPLLIYTSPASYEIIRECTQKKTR